ncbi:alcohol dehydrogenase [Longispora fulva]|uniref:NADPH:quinone reductase-like Zn-dependent oxidoreductase n=1 Tax=Longispora fulva TaxID=619741 RepID=A0A8J7GT89_9ACTN|nr:zinc-binding dehydrogenase [Longispora fulva]MBG6136756.1 NADPH:quinone reductase-like Zn-dependent oxidoreductase [Longispora fulva]GIG59927.1 alcohol dehydrogenase [Longispora fulva]
MRAIVISRHGGPEVLIPADLPDPVAADGEVLIRVRAFGLNHAELYMRDGSWGDLAPVPGIECAGTVESDPAGRLAPGTRVVALMGGLGRTRNGSYAELVTVPATNVVPVDTTLSWPDLAALPEVYATAWSGLRTCLDLARGETVVIRGATSSLGQAAVNIAADLGATVLATTRTPARRDLLLGLGAHRVLLDDGDLAAQVASAGITVDAVADLVGNSALRDSLRTVRPRGRVCQLGFLGGQAPVRDFNPIADLPTGVHLSFFGSFMLGTEHFGLHDVPLAALIAKAEAGAYQARPRRVFAFDDIVDAHRVMEANQAGGKLVVAVG